MHFLDRHIKCTSFQKSNLRALSSVSEKSAPNLQNRKQGIKCSVRNSVPCFEKSQIGDNVRAPCERARLRASPREDVRGRVRFRPEFRVRKQGAAMRRPHASPPETARSFETTGARRSAKADFPCLARGRMVEFAATTAISRSAGVLHLKTAKLSRRGTPAAARSGAPRLVSSSRALGRAPGGEQPEARPFLCPRAVSVTPGRGEETRPSN